MGENHRHIDTETSVHRAAEASDAGQVKISCIFPLAAAQVSLPLAMGGLTKLLSGFDQDVAMHLFPGRNIDCAAAISRQR